MCLFLAGTKKSDKTMERNLNYAPAKWRSYAKRRPGLQDGESREFFIGAAAVEAAVEAAAAAALERR
jgi:hypothetical protein